MFINYIEKKKKKAGANIKKNDESLLKNLNGKKKKGCCQADLFIFFSDIYTNINIFSILYISHLIKIM